MQCINCDSLDHFTQRLYAYYIICCIDVRDDGDDDDYHDDNDIIHLWKSRAVNTNQFAGNDMARRKTSLKASDLAMRTVDATHQSPTIQWETDENVNDNLLFTQGDWGEGGYLIIFCG